MKEIKQNVKAAQISKQTLDDAMKELIKEDTASTKLSSAFKGHKGRKECNYIGGQSRAHFLKSVHKSS